MHMSTATASVAAMANSGFVPEWTIGDRLRKARESTGATQAEFAERLGVARNTINNYELGKTKPRRPLMLVWSMESGVSLSWILTGNPNWPNNDETPDPEGPGVPEKLPRLDSNQQPSD